MEVKREGKYGSKQRRKIWKLLDKENMEVNIREGKYGSINREGKYGSKQIRKIWK